MTCGIYKIENKINGHCYIGQSLNIEERWKTHRKAPYCCNEGYDYPLYKAIRKYGLENFIFEILEKCEIENLDDREIYWINYYNSYINGYNQTLGGRSKKFCGFKLTYEQVLLIKDKLKYTKETMLSISEEFNVDNHTITNINVGKYWHLGDDYPIRPMTINICEKCGKHISNGNKGKVCIECLEKEKVKNYPLREELKYKLRTMSLIDVWKTYNLSRKSLQTCCKYYNLPYIKGIIDSYSDEEWDKI